MGEHELGDLRLVVEQRSLRGERAGPALRVREAATGRELLRFDCFERGAHYHVDPGGSDIIARIEPYTDPVTWAVGELRRDLPGYLKRAGFELQRPPAAAGLHATLDRVEGEMRNPPPDFDDLDLARLRANPGEKWGLYPDDVLPAWVADMDFPVAEPIRTALRRAVDRSYLGYPVNPRPHDLPAVFAERMQRRFGWGVDPHRVEVLTDVVQGIHVALETCTEPGDGVVIQTPIYPPFLAAVRETRRRMVESPLVQGPERYEVDLDALRSAVDDGTRVLLLSHPHNPTGRAFTRAELEGLAEVALERDLLVVSDEIHADLVFPGREHVPFAKLGPEVEARTLTLTSATKAFNIAGVRCALAAFGSRELQRRFNSLPRHVRGGSNSLGLAATEAAWRHAQPWLDAALDHLAANRDLVARFLAERVPRIRFAPPEATYLAWLDCRGLALDREPHDFFLERARVALSPGPVFGRPGRGFVRLNFGTSCPLLDEILERMAGALESRG